MKSVDKVTAKDSSSILGFSFKIHRELSVTELKKSYGTILSKYVECVKDDEEYASHNLRSIESIRGQIDSHIKDKNDLSYLFIVCNIKDYDVAEFGTLTIKYKEDLEQNGKIVPRSRQECWITIAIRKLKDSSVEIFIYGWFDPENLELSKKYQGLKGVIHSQYKLHEEIDPKLAANSVADALEGIGKIPFIKRENAALVIDCHKLMVERLPEISDAGLYHKPTLEDILFFLDKILNKDPNYLPSTRLINSLAETLSIPVYAPKQDEEDLPLKVLKLIYDLAKQGHTRISLDLKQLREDEDTDYINQYFGSIREHYTAKSLLDYSQLLNTGVLDNDTLQKFHLSLENRILFLKLQAFFSPETLSKEDIDEFLRLFSNNQSVQQLEIRKLESKLQELDKELSEIGLVNDRGELYPELKEKKARIYVIQDQKKRISQEIEVLSAGQITKTYTIDSIIVLLEQKVQADVNCKLHQGTIEKMIELAQSFKDESTRVAAVKILLKDSNSLSSEQAKIILNDILPSLDQNGNIDTILDFVVKFKLQGILGPSNADSLIKSMVNILICNKDVEVRKKALVILKNYPYEHLESAVKDIIALEDALSDFVPTSMITPLPTLSDVSTTEEFILTKCLTRVSNSQKLTFNCFIFIAIKKLWADEIVSRIVKQIIEQRIQELPKQFVLDFVSHLDSLSIDSNVKEINGAVTIGKVFIQANLINSDNGTIAKIWSLIEQLPLPDDIDDLLDFTRIEIEANRRENIPESIIRKIEEVAISNKYAANILVLFKTNKLGIVLNSRESLQDREQALDDILSNKMMSDYDKVKFLNSLVGSASDLKVKGFKELTKILSADCLKKGGGILDTGSIAKSLIDVDVDLEDINTFVTKVSESNIDLSEFINLLIVKAIRISTIDQSDTIYVQLNEQFIALHGFCDLINDLVKLQVENSKLQKQLSQLLGIASYTSNSRVRTELIKIIESNVAENDDEGIKEDLENLSSSSRISFSKETIAKDLGNLEAEVSKGYKVHDSQLSSLVNILDSSETKDYHRDVSRLLLEISNRLSLTSSVMERVSDIVLKNQELLEDKYVIYFVSNNINNIPGKQLANIRDILEKALINEASDELIYFFYSIIQSPTFIISDEALISVSKYLSDIQHKIELRTYAALIISNQITKESRKENLKQSVVDKLKEVAVAPRVPDAQHDLLSKVVFQVLEKFLLPLQETKMVSEFLQRYYQELRIRLSQESYLPEQSVKYLDLLSKYFTDDSINLKTTYFLLDALNESLCTNSVDLSIFTDGHQKIWCLRILRNTLLHTINQLPVSEVSADELTSFIENLELLGKRLASGNKYQIANKREKSSDDSIANVMIEDVLRILIKKQRIYQLNLVDINDILYFTIFSDAALQLILKSQTNHPLLELAESFLFDKINSVKGFEEDIRTLGKYVVNYRAHITRNFLNKIKELKSLANLANTEGVIKQLVKFFAILRNCDLSYKEIESILSKNIRDNISVYDLVERVHRVLVRKVLTKKIPNYQEYVQNDINTFISKDTSENAYNQADNPKYWYSSFDIAAISSELMQGFFPSFVITQALGKQDNQSIDSFLVKVLEEYKESKKTTFIPLNIAENHWISLVMIADGRQNIALYKDSRGELNHPDEREKIKKVLAANLDNLEFKFNVNREQKDDYSCGIFALANIRYIAQKIKEGEENKDLLQHFLQNFTYDSGFTTQQQVDNLRKEEFPKLYVLSHCIDYKKRYVIQHHESELDELKELLTNGLGCKVVLNGQGISTEGIGIEISTNQDEYYNNSEYSYKYRISLVKVDSIDRGFVDRVMQVLKIASKSEYSFSEGVICISDQKLDLKSKKPKLQNLSIMQASEYISEQQLEDIYLRLVIKNNQSTRNKLMVQLGFPELKSNEPIGLKDSIWLKGLEQKLARVLEQDNSKSALSYNFVKDLVNKLDTTDQVQDLSLALDIIYEYGLKEDDINIKGQNLNFIFARGNWAKEVHQFAIDKTFQGNSKARSLETLTNEILDLNKDNNIEYLTQFGLQQEYDKIIVAYNGYSELLSASTSTISQWKRDSIKIWADKVKLDHQKANIYEKLAIVRRAVEVITESKGKRITPREIQMLSALILLNNKPGYGRLAQINTGEGKTTIVAMLAVIKALEGAKHQVDIITSSSELAQPQSEQQVEFFELFGLTVSHNGQNSSVGIKTRYQANIVYGAVGDFQGDVLRDEYSKLETRSGRECSVAIVDEVDSMLIDGKNNIVMLSSPMPAMDYLEHVLAAIWTQLTVASNCIVEKENGQVFYRTQDQSIDADGNPVGDITYTDTPMATGKKKVEILQEVTELHIRKMLRDDKDKDEGYLSKEDCKILEKQDKEFECFERRLKENPALKEKVPSVYPKICIPKHLRDLVKKVQLPKWINSAIHAMYSYELDKHYILKDGRFIAPVDATNTGVVQANMVWSDGLHQFLQIKHGTKITAESLTNNLISNVAYFKRYGPNIYGLTGTLGSLEARALLNSTYKVDSIIIPPFKEKRYKELESIVIDTERSWYKNIVESCLSKLLCGRGALVITKYIKEVEVIKELLENEYGYDSGNIKLYKTEKDSDVIKNELKAGEIILATNIAGRGTDINPSSKIEDNGGLHVCITFLPPNQRVEYQNTGRTSRTGNKGTAQFILLDRTRSKIKILKDHRDKQETDDIKKAEAEMRKVTIKDFWFKGFCDLLSIIAPTKEERKDSKSRAVEERFGIWLKLQETIINEQSVISEDQQLEMFNKFKEEILADKGQAKLIQNPFFHILKGNELLKDGQNRTKTIEAIAEYTKAIELDSYFAFNAYYNRGFAKIAAYGQDRTNYKQEIASAVNDFKEARRIIVEHLEPLLSLIQKTSYSQCLSEQVQHKLALYNMQKEAIGAAIGQGVGSGRQLIDKLKAQITQGEKENKQIPGIDRLIVSMKSKAASLENIDSMIDEIRKMEEQKHHLDLDKEDADELQQVLIKLQESLVSKKADKSFKQAQKDEEIRLDHYKQELDTKLSILTRQQTLLNEKLNEAERALSGAKEECKSQKQEKVSEIKEDIQEIEKTTEDTKNYISQLEQNITAIKSTDSFIDITKDITRINEYREQLKGLHRKQRKAIQSQIDSFYIKGSKEVNQDKIDNIDIGVIGVAQKADHYIKIKITDIESALPAEEDSLLFEHEIAEHKNNGLIGSIVVEDIRPIDWWSVIGLMIMGICQIVAGAVLTVCTLGIAASIGSGMLLEGVSDLITAVRDGIINRNFDWKSWGIQKAISFTVSIVCAGIGALKAMFVTAAEAAKVVAKAAVQSTATLVAKSIGIALAKGIAKECVTHLVDYGVNRALMPNIEREITAAIKKPIQDALLHNPEVKKMLELDGLNRNKKYENLIKQKGLAILFPQSGDQPTDLSKIWHGVLAGVARSQISGLDNAMKVYEAIAAIKQLKDMVPEFIIELNKVIKEISEDYKIEEELLQKQPKVAQQHSDKEENKQRLATASQLSDAPEIEGDDIENKIGRAGNKEVQKEVQATLEKRELRSINELQGVLAATVGGKMSDIIAQKLIKPVTNSSIQFGIGKAFEGMEKELQDGINARHEHKRKLEAAAEALKKQEEEDREEEAQYKQALNKAKEEANSEKCKNLAKELKDGNEDFHPINDHDISNIAEAEERHIIVKDKDGNIIHKAGEEYSSAEKQTVVLILTNNDSKSGIGHYQLEGEISKGSQIGEYSCGQEALARAFDKDPYEMDAKVRMMHAELIEYQAIGCNTIYPGDTVEDINKKLSEIKKQHLVGGGKYVNVEVKKVHRRECDRKVQSLDHNVNNVLERLATGAFENNPDISKKESNLNTTLAGSAVSRTVADLAVIAAKKLKTVGKFSVSDKTRLSNLKEKAGIFQANFQGRFNGEYKNVHLNVTQETVKEKDEYKKFSVQIQKGLTMTLLACMESIPPSFYEYTMEGIGDILGLRVRAETSKTGLTSTLVLLGIYIFSEKRNNIQVLLSYLSLHVGDKNSIIRINMPVVLAPISLYCKHAVGIMFVAQEDASGYKAFYLDPENNAIPEGLAAILKDNGYEIEQLPTEGQRYTNCGPEVIENFMLYLTGERLSQEDAIVNNSRLVEQELLSSSDTGEKAHCLTIKDSYSTQETLTVLSNAAGNTQVSRDDYIIDHHARYDIVTPQSIIDGVIVRADSGTAPRELLIGLLSDYSTNQDYTEAILGEVSCIDIS